MNNMVDRPHVYPAEDAWDEDDVFDRPRPGYIRTSQKAQDWPAPDADEANSDLGNSGRDVREATNGHSY